MTMFFMVKINNLVGVCMAEKKNIAKAVLQLLTEKPYERTIAQIAKALELSTTEVHFTVRTLVELGEIVLTRKAGNAQMYCKKELKAQII